MVDTLSPSRSPGGLRLAPLAYLIGAFASLFLGAALEVRFTSGAAGTALYGAALLLTFVGLLLSVRSLRPSGFTRGWYALSLALLAASGTLALLVSFPWLRLLPGLIGVISVLLLIARPGHLSRQVSATLWGWLLTLPALILLGAWHFAPAFYAFWISLFDRVNFVRTPNFVGFENYLIALTNDPMFWKALRNSLWFVALTVPTGIALATVVAILLNQKVRFLSLWRTLFFLPYITALTAAAAVWRWIYDPQFGLLNRALNTPGLDWLNTPEGIFGLALGRFGLEVPEAWAGPSVALCAVIVMSIWHQLGYGVVILLAGLQSIPQEYYEAAQLDGAGWWDQIRHITWPLLSPTTFFLAVTGLIGAFQVFTQIYVLTPTGGVLGDTTTIVMYLYNKGFRDSNFSYASALAFILFVLVFVGTLVQNRVLSRRVTYDL